MIPARTADARSTSPRSFTSATTGWPPTKFRRQSVSCRRSSLPPPASWPVMRKVVVTGGSRGLGLAIVRRLICEGYCAIAVARQLNDQLASTMEQVERAEQPNKGSVQFLPFDLGEIEEIPNFVKKLRKDFG